MRGLRIRGFSANGAESGASGSGVPADFFIGCHERFFCQNFKHPDALFSGGLRKDDFGDAVFLRMISKDGANSVFRQKGKSLWQCFFKDAQFVVNCDSDRLESRLNVVSVGAAQS